jgi:hypothetical protein
MIKVENIVTVRTGLYMIVYTHTCDCGCKTTRHNLTVTGNKPNNTEALILANEDYN